VILNYCQDSGETDELLYIYSTHIYTRVTYKIVNNMYPQGTRFLTNDCVECRQVKL
jgi:hypothetical protein